MQVPDPIELLRKRGGGNAPGQLLGGPQRQADPTPWLPFLKMAALAPNAGGGLIAGLTDMMAQYVRKPTVSEVAVIDFNELDDILLDHYNQGA